MWRSRWRCVIRPAYSVSFLLSTNIVARQNVLYFPNDLRSFSLSVLCSKTKYFRYVIDLNRRQTGRSLQWMCPFIEIKRNIALTKISLYVIVARLYFKRYVNKFKSVISPCLFVCYTKNRAATDKYFKNYFLGSGYVTVLFKPIKLIGNNIFFPIISTIKALWVGNTLQEGLCNS